MSTGIKMDYDRASVLAQRFRDLFDGCYAQWEVAGSIRRRKAQCGDAEHVCISRLVSVASNELFATPKPVNAIWKRLEELEAAGTVIRHVYGDTGFRWGEKYRGVEFKGVLQEIYQADADNWGATLAIRTGSAEFSQKLVTGLLRNGHRNYKGHVWRCEPCLSDSEGFNGRHPKTCACEGTKLLPVEKIAARDEEEYFRLCGIAWTEPEKR